MRRFHLAAVVGCAALVPYSILLCGGRSLLAERVAALEAVVNEQLVVVDANGSVLGALVNGMDANDYGSADRLNSGTVALDLEGFPLLPVHVRRNELSGSAAAVWFTSSDCTGTPLFHSEVSGQYSAPVLAATIVIGQGETIFYSDLDASPQVVTTHSDLTSAFGCRSNTQSASPFVPGFRASLQRFTPPYSVVTRGELASP